jgi:hypothetical protein
MSAIVLANFFAISFATVAEHRLARFGIVA